jgi:hypothetical protein
MNDEYRTRMAHAEDCEQLIARFRSGDDPDGELFRLNFAGKALRDWQEVVRSYQEAFDIYHQFNQQGKARDLLDSLFDLVHTCDELTSSFAIQLLSTLKNSCEWLERVVPGTRDRLKTALRTAIGRKLLQKEMEFWLLHNALGFLRDLVNGDPERRSIDMWLCQTMVLGAQVSFRRGNWDNAEGWYRDAARIAQDRVGDARWAAQLLQMASSVQQMRIGQPPDSAAAQAMQAQAPSSPEDGVAIRQMGIAGDLEAILHRTLQEQHKERFLPPLQEMLADYERREDKLVALLEDERLLVDRSKVEARVAQYQGQGLSAWIPGQFVDSQGNPRGDFDANARFTVQCVGEVAEAVGTFFATWQGRDCLTESQIAHMLRHTGSYFDWRIYEVGLSRHFQLDFVCAAHTLIPQFEHVVKASAQATGIDVKRFKRGVPGEVLLNDLIHPNNTEMQALLGEGLFDLVYWYMVNSSSPFGYRHKVAHGWIRPENCDLQLSATTIWLTLRVVDAVAKRMPKGYDG